MERKISNGKIVSAVALLAIGWFANELIDFGDGEKVEALPTAPMVAASTVTRQAINPVTEYVGHVEAVQETDILPQIDGYIKKVCFEEGAKVAAGDLLFEIDDEQYLAARNLRLSEISSAKAKVIVAKSDVDRAERYYKRLSAADDRGITETELDVAETTLASARAELNSANAAVEQAKAAAAIAEFNLKHTKVFSPISGRIGKALHHVGDYVSPSKTALAQVVQIDPIRVVFPITDKDYGNWQSAAERGGRAFADVRRLRIKLANGELYDQSGIIEFGNNKVDRETASVVLRARFANAAGALLPNAFVRVLSDDARPSLTLAIPVGAVERTAKGTHAWILNGDNTVKMQPIEIGSAWQGLVSVQKGLKDGDRIVVAGGFKLHDGQKVNVAQ